jgi:DnaJ-class molecular chaperone
MADFDAIDKARRLLGLGEDASMRQIKSAYRRLAKHHHPDKHSTSSDEEMMKKLNQAYKVLMDYCRDYRYSFQEEDVARAYPKDEYIRTWRKRWYDSI